MDLNAIKEKITRKHVIAGISALVVVAGGITIGAIAMGGDDEKATNNNTVVENVTEATTEPVVTTATTTATTTTVTTTTTTTTTTKATTEKKKEEKKETKTETKQEEQSYYEEPVYEEPVYEEPVVEEPVVEAPAPEPEPEPEPVPEPAPEVNNSPYPDWYGDYEKSLFDYAISQGCSASQAKRYVNLVGRAGEENVIIGYPPNVEGAWWDVWGWNGEAWCT